MNERELNQTIARYGKIIGRLTSSVRLVMSKEDYEELFSDCLLAVYRAIEKYDAKKGACLDTFVWKCVSNQIGTSMAIYNKKRERESGITAWCVDDIDWAVSDRGVAEQSIFDLIDLSYVVENSCGLGRDAIEYFLQGLTISEIGAKMGVTRQRASVVFNREVSRVRKNYSGEE